MRTSWRRSYCYREWRLGLGQSEALGKVREMCFEDYAVIFLRKKKVSYISKEYLLIDSSIIWSGKSKKILGITESVIWSYEAIRYLCL
jgi:hypothetical protein